MTLEPATITYDEPTRAQIWLNTWLSVAVTQGCVKPEVATSWADCCLKDFDERFNNLLTHTKL